MKLTDVGHDTRAAALREAKMLNKIAGKRRWRVMARYIVYRPPA